MMTARAIGRDLTPEVLRKLTRETCAQCASESGSSPSPQLVKLALRIDWPFFEKHMPPTSFVCPQCAGLSGVQ